jgi:hypothetical protein
LSWKSDGKYLVLILAVFLALFYLPVDDISLPAPLAESLALAKWYAREHVILCLIPAFFIAGAIAVFVSQGSVMKYLGARANKILAYSVASVSGSILAVCSCTVLPLFAGIHRMGAGIGPATAFLYSGPAINVLAMILTARVLGLELGIARAVAAVAFSIVIGLLMQLVFHRDEREQAAARMVYPEPESGRPLWQNAVFFAALLAILVFANWGKPADSSGIWAVIYDGKWFFTAAATVALGVILALWFRLPKATLFLTGVLVAASAIIFPSRPLLAFSVGVAGVSISASRGGGESESWLRETWGFAKQILPLLLIGVLIAGLLLGRPGDEGLIPSQWIATWVGGESLSANLIAAVIGAFMYFATLTEVPILQGLIGNGMGRGPALALLLAGPALSLPNMLVIRSVLGTAKTVVFVLLVITMATLSGIIYGMLI